MILRSIQRAENFFTKDQVWALEIQARRVYHPVAVARRQTFQALLAMLLLVFFSSGCAASLANGGWAGSSVTRGLVQLSPRSDELLLVVSGSPLRMQMSKDHAAQLDRLSGAFVAVRGPRSKEQIIVRGFEILEAPDGLAPMIGRVIVDQSGVMLEDQVSRSRLALRGVALVALKKEHAAKIWVTGSIVGPQTLLVAHWGLLIPAP
jgi:hypothetical protein